MQNIYLYNYNNYYNRQVKRYDTLDEYAQHKVAEPIVNVNFNPNDGIMTKHLIGDGNAKWDVSPDYLIVSDDNVNITSRWFVLEQARTRGNQFVLTLYRDVFADFYDKIIEAPAYIEKATLRSTDPFIYNKENVTFNQIKREEYLITDNTGIPWIVGYCPKNAFISGEVVESNTIITYTENDADETVADINTLSLPGIYYTVEGLTYAPFDTYVNRGGGPGATMRLYYGQYAYAEPGWPNWYSASYNNYLGYYDDIEFNNQIDQVRSVMRNYSRNDLKSLFERCEEELWIKALDGKKIFETNTNTLYTIVVTDAGYRDEEVIVNDESNVHYNLNNMMLAGFSVTTNNDRQKPQFRGRYIGQVYNVQLKKLGDIVKSAIRFPNSDIRQHTVDASYDVFAIPAGEKEFTIRRSDDTIINGKLPSIEAAIELATRFAEFTVGENSKIYDIQILPYCPIPDIQVLSTATDEELNWGKLSEDRDFNVFINDADSVVSILTWAKFSSGSINNRYYRPISSDAIEVKIASECDMYRLVSPNWNGQFEFNAAKNFGILGIEIDYAYKPYSPYIHVNPIFGGLYGRDFNDARGLICGGDFSLTQFSNAYINYQMNNKNFQSIFDRQIQNLELTQSVERKKQIVGATLGAITGAAGGAIAGSNAGPVGAIAGAAIGGAASAIGGALDVHYGDILRDETLDYTKDLYGYNLDNIRAMPDNLTKVSSYNPNNKIFPIIEYYTCTDEEKNSLRNKLKYNGMTVMRIGTISEFLQKDESYIKGKIIRLEDLSEDAHLANIIAKEFNKGVFIK